MVDYILLLFPEARLLSLEHEPQGKYIANNIISYHHTQNPHNNTDKDQCSSLQSRITLRSLHLHFRHHSKGSHNLPEFGIEDRRGLESTVEVRQSMQLLNC